MNTKEKIGQKIRALRQKQGFTIEELADRSGLHYNHIGEIERGAKNLTLDSLEKVTNALGIKLANLLTFEPSKIDKQTSKEDQNYRLARQMLSLIKDKNHSQKKKIITLLKTFSKEIK